MLSEQIRKLRQKALYSQESFAKALGVANSTINRWETSKSRPNITAMKNIKKFCEDNGLSYEVIESEWMLAEEGKSHE